MDSPLTFRYGPTADNLTNQTGDFSKLDLQLSTPLPPAGDYGKCALVLGGNGFLGIHLIHALVRRPSMKTVYCLLRGGSGQSLVDKIKKCAAEYDLEFQDSEFEKLRLINTNILNPNFGLEEKMYNDLCTQVDTVFQYSGIMDYSLTYEEGYHKWTVLLLDILNFCIKTRLKQLIYSGSISSALFAFPHDFERPYSWWYSGYSRSKMISLEILKRAHALGIPTIYMQVGFTLGSTTAFKDPGLKYTFYRFMKFYNLHGIVTHMSLPIIPVDILMDCLMMSAYSGKEQPLVVFPSINISFMDLAEVYGLKPVTLEVLHALAKKAKWDSLLKVFPPGTIEASLRVCSDPIFPNGFNQSILPCKKFLLEQYRTYNPSIYISKHKRRSLL